MKVISALALTAVAASLSGAEGVFFMRDFQVEYLALTNAPVASVQAVMALPKAEKMSIKPRRAAIVLPVDAATGDAMLGFSPLDGSSYPEFSRVSMMADLATRGYICIAASIKGKSADESRTVVSGLVDALVADPRVDANAIGAAGHAGGGDVAIAAGLADARIKAVLASVPSDVSAKAAEGANERMKTLPPQKGMRVPPKCDLDQGYDFLDSILDVGMEAEIAPPADQPCAKIEWVREICRETNRQIGWPTVCRRRNGELLAVFSGDRNSHVCPYGKVQLVRSHDNGETWSAPETVVDDLLDDRDAGLIELDNGDLLLFYFNSICFSFDTWNVRHAGYRQHWMKLPKDLVRKELGYFSRRSADGGKTWEAPVRMYVSTPHGGIQLRDGRVLTVGRHWAAEGNAMPDEAARRGNGNEIAIDMSVDRGRSWQVLSRIDPGEFDIAVMHEPHMVERTDGTLIMLCNHMAGQRHLLQSESHDGGKTWSRFRETSIDGYPSHLMNLPDGRLLVSYACRKAGHEGEYAAVSDDGGATWKAAGEILLARALCADIGYPSTVALPDGSLLTVYYQSPRHFNLPSLMATKWRLLK